MSLPTPETARQRTAVGQLRPSQLLYTFGIGAVVDLPKIAAMVMGIDDWDVAYCQPISEERLLRAVQEVLGGQVRSLRSPPIPPETSGSEPFSDSAKIGVPVAPFPRWMVCPYCHLLAPLGSSMIDLQPHPYRPERTSYRHVNCNKPGRPPTMLPARFLLACKNGHLDDFPWHWFTHKGPSECVGALKLYVLSLSGEASSVEARCEACGSGRRLSDAFGEGAAGNLPPRCPGRRPHLRDYDEVECAEPLKAILLGASNSWFPLTQSALYVPVSADPLDQLVEEHWATLEKVTEPGGITLLRSLNLLNAFAVYADAAVWAVVERRRNPEEAREESLEPTDLKTPEWRVFSQPDSCPPAPDFLLTPVAPPRGFEQPFKKVVLAERLREARALIGFTRIESPGEFSEPEEVPAARIGAISRKPPTWVPAFEVRGEGLFLEFRQEALKDWLSRPAVQDRQRAFFEGHRRWRDARRIPSPEGGFPGLGYVMIHSFAHALMRQLALECGYASAGIRERIYWRSPEFEEPMAGVLIYTAAPDSEGTLGGLVSLGRPDLLGEHIRQAMDMAGLCASDPLCAEHRPLGDALSLHGAACHACQFMPETSCERGNRYLDRSLITPTVEIPDVAFFDARDSHPACL